MNLVEKLSEGEAYHRSGDLSRAEAIYSGILDHDPENPDALHLSGKLALQKGDTHLAARLIKRAIDINPDAETYHDSLGSAMKALGALDAAAEHYRLALLLNHDFQPTRRNLALMLQQHVSDDELRDLFVATTSKLGLVGDFRDLQSRLSLARSRKRLIVIAAAPKTASTFLANLLAHLMGYRLVNLCYSFVHNEHDLYPPNLLANNSLGAVSQLHMKGTVPNANLMRFFGIKPIIMVRNFYDIVASLFDQLRDYDYARSGNHFSFAWTDAHFLELADSTKLDFIVDTMLPWYINFYVSWSTLIKEKAIDAIWVSYDDVVGDTLGTVERILSFLAIRVEADWLKIACDAVIADRKRLPKFNKGVSGRGDQLLSQEQKARIQRMAAYYPHIDFSPWGISH